MIIQRAGKPRAGIRPRISGLLERPLNLTIKGTSAPGRNFSPERCCGAANHDGLIFVDQWFRLRSHDDCLPNSACNLRNVSEPSQRPLCSGDGSKAPRRVMRFVTAMLIFASHRLRNRIRSMPVARMAMAMMASTLTVHQSHGCPTPVPPTPAP